MELDKPKSHTLINGIAIGLTIAVFIILGFTHYIGQTKKPEMPISVSTRQALFGAGLVAQFTNNSDRFLAVIATFKNPTTSQQESFRLDLSPKSLKEVGHLEGWTFVSGDEINIQHNDYEPLSRTIN